MDTTIIQIGIVVNDVEQTAANAQAILGFDYPPDIKPTRGHDQTDATYHGQPTDARAKISCVDRGQIQLEYLQPLGPPSAWQDFLDQRGDGIHHIAFYVDDTDAGIAHFKKHGYQVIQQGQFNNGSGMYTYLDTDKDMGIVIELLQHMDGNAAIQGPAFAPERGLGTDIVCQVGLIVNDIERTVQRYVEVLGISAPPILEAPGYDIAKTTYHGEPSDATAKLAFMDMGQVQLELIQPDEKPSTWRKFLDAYGEGAHHIAFPVTGTQRQTDYLARHGIVVEQQGLYADASGQYTYLDSQAKLGTTIELLESF